MKEGKMRVGYEYRQAFSEMLDILNHTNKEDVEKIPIKVIEFFKANELKTYESKIDFNNSISNMDLSPKTIGILSLIYKKYWCDINQRKDFEEKLIQNEIIYQEQLSYKYNVDKIFKNKNEVKKENVDNTYLIKYEEIKWYQKIFKKFLNIFNKNN